MMCVESLEYEACFVIPEKKVKKNLFSVKIAAKPSAKSRVSTDNWFSILYMFEIMMNTFEVRI